MNIVYSAKARRLRNGWLAQFTWTTPDGVARTELVRDARNRPIVYSHEIPAQFAADRALRRALNGDGPTPVKGKVYEVRQVGGRSKIRQIADKLFR